MSANNQVILIGRAGNNPGEDIRHLQSGSKVAKLRLAVNRPGKDQMGNQVTEWPDKNGIRDGVVYSNKAWGMAVYVFRRSGRITVREQV